MCGLSRAVSPARPADKPWCLNKTYACMAKITHPLHLAIGEFLQSTRLPDDCRLIRAPECGGTHNLPLFSHEEKSNESEYCNVDALVVRNSAICFLLEIEESGLNPVKICGKFLASALSSHFVHDVLNNVASAIGPNAVFVQVIDTTRLNPRTKKLRQGKLLESSITKILPVGSSGIRTYRLYFFRGVDGFRSDEALRCDFQNVFAGACRSNTHDLTGRP